MCVCVCVCVCVCAYKGYIIIKSLFTIAIAMTEWIGKWKSNGWRTVNNEDVKNKEDIQCLDSLCQDINVEWVSM